MTKNLFRGNPRLLVFALPWAAGVIALKAIIDALDAQFLELSPLLAGAIAAEVFVLGFLLAGVASDFKEAERLPGEVAASLETMSDECLITWKDLHLPEARACLQQLVGIARSVRMWLVSAQGLDDVLSDLRALNDPFLVIAPKIQAGFTTRLKGEQHNIRRLVLRMDVVRRTSYVSAGYLIAEVTGVLLIAVLLFTDLGALAPTLCLVGLLTYLLIYLTTLIRDLDNPFEYQNGVPGPADVNLDVLERSEDRMRALLGALDAEPAPVVPPITSAPPADAPVIAADSSGEPPA